MNARTKFAFSPTSFDHLESREVLSSIHFQHAIVAAHARGVQAPHVYLMHAAPVVTTHAAIAMPVSHAVSASAGEFVTPAATTAVGSGGGYTYTGQAGPVTAGGVTRWSRGF